MREVGRRGGNMLEIVVLAILVVGVGCGTVLIANEKEAASRTWPVIRPALESGQPAEEGAPVADVGTGTVEPEEREAA